jgi:general secretion pathway protein A
MIEAYYNLKTTPFRKDINPKDIFISDSSRELSRRLEHMKQTRGFMLITGTPGTGKTLHVRSFSDGLNPNLYKVVYAPLSTVNMLEFYRQISVLLGENRSIESLNSSIPSSTPLGTTFKIRRRSRSSSSMKRTS